jgi:predicted amidohydrolase
MTLDGRRLRVAVAQVRVGDDIVANTGAILSAMARCAVEDVEVVVFPEAALTGYSPALGRGRTAAEWSTIREALDAVAAQARGLGLWVVVGTEALDGEDWVNRAVVFSDAGEVAATYDKMHLMGPDRPYYRPGTAPTLFDLRGVRVGLQICYDVRFPEGYRALLHGGAEVVLQGFYGLGTGKWKVPVLTGHLRSRAAENGVFVAIANAAGPEQIVYSQIIDPLGLVLAEARPEEEDLVVASLPLARIADSEIRRDYWQYHAPADLEEIGS